MKILSSNKKGLSLVMLLAVMTLIAILGTSFVSLMESKQKGFLRQIDSYRALNNANAGVEYAIRYISDSLGDASSSYFQNLPARLPDTSPYVPFHFAAGTFEVNRTFSYDMNQDSRNPDKIEVTGKFGETSRTVRIVRFRRYISALTLVSNPNLSHAQRRPTINPLNNRQILIRFMNNSEPVNIARLRITIHFDPPYGATPMVLNNIYFNGIAGYTGSLDFSPANPPPLIDISSGLIPETTGDSTITNCILEFQDPVSESHLYELEFHVGVIANSVIRFTLP